MYSLRCLQHLVGRSLNTRTDFSKFLRNFSGNWRKKSLKESMEIPSRPNPLVKQVKTEAFRSIFTGELRTLIDLFRKYDYELRLAGGAVRDILMSIEPKDLDFATTATPQQMKNMFDTEEIRMINAKGEKHGTITVRINNQNFEITTLRIDTVTNGRHAEVEFTTNWLLDANRRDLTINSMFLDFDGNVYDYFYGCEDLEKRRVVFVGNAATRIQEDYLRILRYFRFYGRIATEPNNHDELILKTITDLGSGLQRISGERIWSELQRIILGNYALEIIEVMLKCNLGEYCGLPPEPNLEEMRKVYKDLNELDCGNFPPIHIMTALLRTKDDVTRMHARLKLSAFERDSAYFITEHRDKVDNEYQTLNDYQKLCFKYFIKREFVEEILRYKGRKQFYQELKNWKRPYFPVKGNVLKEMGVTDGRCLGEILNRLSQVWADSNFKLTEKELIDDHLPKIQEEISKNLDAVKSKKKKIA